ncbi:MAG TPA: hypothetical protein VJ464_17635 [Blastocatellia bacterium]|nr:hypothetical protein [Blastocatellia bacterium]
MATQALPSQRFIRKTELGPNEYRKRFRQIDDEIIAALTSPEADAVTPLMSKIYLRLTTAPDRCWERQGVLRFEAEVREGKRLTAWAVLCASLNVSSATANKALAWMHTQGIIGYFAGKNGVGVRIFLNRAASSVGIKPTPGGKKILAFSHASNGEARASRNEAAFNDTFGDLEVLEPDNSGAPASGAENSPAIQTSPSRQPQRSPVSQGAVGSSPAEVTAPADLFGSIDEVVRRLKFELEPALRMAAAQAATREHERTREWLEERGLPKAARVAQREAFNVLRQHGLIKNSARAARAELAVGQHKAVACEPKVLNADEVREVAEICLSLLECHGQAIDVTLAEISAEAGGYLLAGDAPKVRELAIAVAGQRSQKE